ncbi:MAG: hypothetical protein JOZ25_11035, partial [Actinobacteria bacterium]|nr:hypothetical protein [Actinomycetota bacterium]
AAAFEGANFPGDETADWFHGSGLQSLASDMLNRAIFGALGFTTDIGGYIDSLSGPTNEELFLRWSEWSALTPFLRIHNDSSDTTKMPWSFGPKVEAVWRGLARLHDRALPLIRRLWARFPSTGLPPTAPLWLAAPGDRGAAVQDQEWMIGPDLLVAPVVVQGATSRAVYFPRGCWQRPGSGQSFTGPGDHVVQAPVAVLPYFSRCGTHPLRVAHPCLMKIGLAPRGKRYVRAEVYSNGRYVKTVHRFKIGTVTFRRSGHGRFRVRLVVHTAGGKRVVIVRRGTGCGRFGQGGRPPRANA